MKQLRPAKHTRFFAFLFFIGLLFTTSITLLTDQQRTNDRQSAAGNIPSGLSAIDSVVYQTLLDQNTNGWDTTSATPGILINWRRDDLSKVNCSASVCDTRGQSTRHDGVNDIRDLENLYWYKFNHRSDTTLDQYIARLAPQVKTQWGNTNLGKGWLYYLLQRMAKYSGDSTFWSATLQHWAAAQYSAIDPKMGIEHGPTGTVAGAGNVNLQDAYRVDHDLENGLALVDAGKRYNHPEWVSAGQKEVDIVIAQTFNTTYHLFNRIYLINDPVDGQNKIYDPQARMAEQGEELEALITTGIFTNNQAYITLATQMLNALQTSPLHDTTDGGFFIQFYLSAFNGHAGGTVDSGKKEGGRQLRTLEIYHLANLALNNQWSAIEQELIQIATTPGKAYFNGTVPGYMYEQLPNWSLVSCLTCTPNPTENWISAEASNIAMEALQTVSSNSSGKPLPTIVSTLTPLPGPSGNGGITLSVTLCPHGLGNCGDNVNPNSGGNTSPKHTQRSVVVTLLDANNTPVTTATGIITYNQTAQNFQGTVSLGTLSNGQYLVQVKTEGFLSKLVPGITSVTNGQSFSLPSVSLVTGDINNDGQIDILDYNILIGCFGSKQNATSCTMPPTTKSAGSDINDDGVIDGVDYNLFLRELSVQKGA